MRLEQANRLAHRRLDVQGLDVLPVLLEKRYKEVNAFKGIVNQIVLSRVAYKVTYST